MTLGLNYAFEKEVTSLIQSVGRPGCPMSSAIEVRHIVMPLKNRETTVNPSVRSVCLENDRYSMYNTPSNHLVVIAIGLDAVYVFINTNCMCPTSFTRHCSY